MPKKTSKKDAKKTKKPTQVQILQEIALDIAKELTDALESDSGTFNEDSEFYEMLEGLRDYTDLLKTLRRPGDIGTVIANLKPMQEFLVKLANHAADFVPYMNDNFDNLEEDDETDL